MKIKSALLTFILAFTFSSASPAHMGGHCDHGAHAPGWLGTVGALFNAAEAFKHGAVIYDQITGPSEEREWKVLIGNSVILTGHLYQAWVQTRDHKPKSRAITIPVLVVATAATSFDLVVDALTATEYWNRAMSVAKVAVNSVAPVCTVLNLHSLYSIATST